MSDETLRDVQDYYDGKAGHLFAVEDRNWHLQSRMALNLDTIDRYAPRPAGRSPEGVAASPRENGANRRARAGTPGP